MRSHYLTSRRSRCCRFRICRAMRADLASEGAAILVISQDLDELLAITDRLAVINVGVLSDPLVTAEASMEEIGLLMGGVHGREAAHGA